jgi:hypothetical protein
LITDIIDKFSFSKLLHFLFAKFFINFFYQTAKAAMTDDQLIAKKAQLQMPEASYYVRRTEKTIDALKKENFNLRLKLHFLEQQQGAALGSTSKAYENQSIENDLDLQFENETLRGKLEENQRLLKESLNVIEMLEMHINEQDVRFNARIEEQNRKIEILMVTTKKCENCLFIIKDFVLHLEQNQERNFHASRSKESNSFKGLAKLFKTSKKPA